jgi:hypothetical protein
MEMNENPTLDHNPEDQPVTPQKHSGLGIASFVIACVAVVFIIIAFVTMVGATSGMTEGMTEEQILSEAPGLVAGVLIFFFVVLLNLVGGILGIIGLFNKNRKKLFAILGTVFNLLGFVLFIIMMIAGFALQGLA